MNETDVRTDTGGGGGKPSIYPTHEFLEKIKI
jgi:hypothetical protein